MNYNWYYAGTMLHMLSTDENMEVTSNITLCNRHVNGWSVENFNHKTHQIKCCNRCIKLKDMVAKKP